MNQFNDKQLEFDGVVAFWLSPKSKITPVKMKHINVVKNNPQMFGFEKEEIEKIFEEENKGKVYNEGGFARDRIFKEIYKRGWVRVRQRKNYWILECWTLEGNTERVVFNWCKAIGEHKKRNNGRLPNSWKTSNIKIVELKDYNEEEKKDAITATTLDAVLEWKQP